MKKKLKKNQIIITALALMIAVAGYVSYTRSNLNGTSEVASADITEDSYEISDSPIVLVVAQCTLRSTGPFLYPV